MATQRTGILDPDEELKKATKAAREALRRAGEIPDLPNAPDELSPPGSSLKVPGGWDIAKGKKKRKRRPLERYV